MALAVLKAVRPAHDANGGFVPQNQIHIREVINVRLPGWQEELWVFGNRPCVHPETRELGYRSVAIKIYGFLYYFYLDAASLTIDEIRACLEFLGKQTRGAVHRWEIVRRRLLVGFDYEEFERSGQLDRQMIKVWIDPSQRRRVKDVLSRPLQDERKKEYKLAVYNDDWDLGTMFLHTYGLQLQTWSEWERLKSVAPGQRQSVCADEFTWSCDPLYVRKAVSAPEVIVFLLLILVILTLPVRLNPCCVLR